MIHVYKDLFVFVSWDIQGLPELADQNNTVNSPSSGNNRKNVQKNLSSIVIRKEAVYIDQSGC
jgi:hypothetical protein